MPAAGSDGASNGTSSHMMKTTKRGRPFLKDTLDLFATLIVSLELTTHKQFFRTFPHSFTTDEACANLASLKFSQSNRGPDPRDPSRIVTTTTTTTFSMTRDMAKAMSQHFMDARLIENATDPTSNLFKDRGTYVLTPKGLHVLERFISKNGINADHLGEVFKTQPICMKLLHLQRRSSDDEIIVTQTVITALFRRFVGTKANYRSENSETMDPFQLYYERAKGIAFMDVADRSQNLLGKNTAVVHKFCFQAVAALEWLCDFTSVVGREEAAEMAAQFVRFGLITLVSDKRKNNDSAIIFTVRGTAPGGNSPIQQHGEFRCTAKAVYKVTEEGRRLARWDANGMSQESPHSSTTNLAAQRTSEDSSVSTAVEGTFSGDSKLTRRLSMAEKLNEGGKKAQKESNTDRLNYIIEDVSLRSMFRDFLRANFCEENLSFWLEVEEFKKKFNVTSSAVASAPSGRSNQRTTPGQAAMERHHEMLIHRAFEIYNRYLAPSAPSELNIDHGLRNELLAYLGEVMTGVNGNQVVGRVEPEQASAFNATQLQTVINLYKRIQMHVFRLMSTDSVPKFIKTPKFAALRNWAEEDEDFDSQSMDPTHPPGLNGDEEIGGTYTTVSQHASEQNGRHRRNQPPAPPS
ncbi:regulator of G protein signaling [Punctularia strigosozonata HHB-11173 SS5]|uniref:regulator of G protein signaling n=1 Tax=Punctularia strigosozonata (strain HHB-11173) TaxID=741275 RepID=UPI0004416C66|nr:regulator of G protein signaling [Punctularia strigosozonata HHB-11173 SS5]EIN10813.1 regulator of G protein signaling [Punctularia strigosozonata HHB-11173 SS5]